VAACKKNLPIIVPGWEDATLGNMFAAAVMRGDVRNVHTVRTGIEYMTWLADYYTKNAKRLRNREGSIGFFQIGGGIAGDFPICVVRCCIRILERTGVPLWGYFCQISDSTTSYGSYSGAVPNEKITWGKLAASTSEVRDRKRRHDLCAPDLRLGAGAITLLRSLVPKLCLGMHLSQKLCFPTGHANAVGGTKAFNADATELRRHVRSQTEFGNENLPCAHACDLPIHQPAKARNACSDIWNSCQSGSIFPPSRS
jgi:hypothetical protein